MKVAYKLLMALGSISLVWLMIVIWNSTSGFITAASLVSLLLLAFGSMAARELKHEFGNS